MSESLSGRKLAEALGYAPSYISKLKSQGVLTVRSANNPGGSLDPDTGQFDVALARAEIEAARDPEKEHVRDRHAANRNTLLEKPADSADSRPADPDGSGKAGGADREEPPAGDADKVVSFQDAKTRKEIFLAKQAELDYLKKLDKVVDKEAVQKAAFKIARMVRDKLTAIPDRECQVLAATTDPNRIAEILNEEIEKVLHELGDSIESAQSTG